MLPLIINSKEVNLPTTWEEVTWRQYAAMSDESKPIAELRLLSALSGIKYETLANVDASAFDKYIPALSFASTPLDLTAISRAESITLRGKSLTIPKDPGLKKLGQKLLLQSKVREAQEEGRETLHLIPFAIAVYVQPQLNNDKISIEQVEELTEEVQDLPLLTVYPTGNFFLTSYLKSLHLNQNT